MTDIPRDNTDFILRLMQYSNNGALMQLFVLEAVRRYGELLRDTPQEAIDNQFGPNSFLSGSAWKKTGEEAVKRLDEYVEKVGEAWKTRPLRITSAWVVDSEDLRDSLDPLGNGTFEVACVRESDLTRHPVAVRRFLLSHVDEGDYLDLLEWRITSVEHDGLVIRVKVNAKRWLGSPAFT